jgi:hypothetical protein
MPHGQSSGCGSTNRAGASARDSSSVNSRARLSSVRTLACFTGVRFEGRAIVPVEPRKAPVPVSTASTTYAENECPPSGEPSRERVNARAAGVVNIRATVLFASLCL